MKETEPMSKIVRPLRSGQITIPAEFRKALGITDQTMLHLTVADGELRIRPVEIKERHPGSTWLRDLYDYFAPVRQEAIEKGYSEQEINADIDAALHAVRKRHE